MIIDRTKPVMVTGATGYVAGRLVEKLLSEGITVHAAVRDPKNETKTAPLKELADKLPGNIHFFEADLLNDSSYDNAAKDCELIFHTASPFVRNVENAQRDLIEPALKGTRNVLETANRIESVKRVVLTSSCAAIYGDAVDLLDYPNGTMTEENWNTTSSLEHQPYSYSKTLAEREAWKIAEQQSRWDLIVINPSLVIGQGINPNATSESFTIFKQIGKGDFKMGAPEYNIGAVDVRDLAEAHFRAAFSPEASGRYIISGESSSFGSVAKELKRKFPSYPIGDRKIPKWLIWLIAPAVGMSRKEVSKNIGYPWKADNSKSIRELQMTYRPAEESAVEFFQFLIDGNQIPKK